MNDSLNGREVISSYRHEWLPEKKTIAMEGSHLWKKTFSPFPKLGERGHRDNYFPCRILELYCDCLMPETYGNMVECEHSFNWFHQDCVDYDNIL